VSFDADKLVDNIEAVLNAINDSKPTWVKGKLIKKVVVSSSMGPWVPLENLDK
jgi:large subunit ribosomal protein L1